MTTPSHVPSIHQPTSRLAFALPQSSSAATASATPFEKDVADLLSRTNNNNTLGSSSPLQSDQVIEKLKFSSVAVSSPSHFDSDWPQVDVGNLLLNLEADINSEEEETERRGQSLHPSCGNGSESLSALTVNSNLPQIPEMAASVSTGSASGTSSSSSSNGAAFATPDADSDKSLKMKIKRTKSGRQEIVKPGSSSGTNDYSANSPPADQTARDGKIHAAASGGSTINGQQPHHKKSTNSNSGDAYDFEDEDAATPTGGSDGAKMSSYSSSGSAASSPTPQTGNGSGPSAKSSSNNINSSSGGSSSSNNVHISGSNKSSNSVSGKNNTSNGNNSSDTSNYLSSVSTSSSSDAVATAAATPDTSAASPAVNNSNNSAPGSPSPSSPNPSGASRAPLPIKSNQSAGLPDHNNSSVAGGGGGNPTGLSSTGAGQTAVSNSISGGGNSNSTVAAIASSSSQMNQLNQLQLPSVNVNAGSAEKGPVFLDPANGTAGEASGMSSAEAASSLSASDNTKVDACTLTDAGTLTEPEILGPCEPGTAVNLEGIVWHETDTGVLVINVTWRGKTYVGTLLDCAKHTNQWSAPRFTDSPEPGGKGRGKRARCANTPSEPEPRKNLRSSKQKGGPGGKGKGGKGAAKAGNGGGSGSGDGSGGEEFNFPAPNSPATVGKDGVVGGNGSASAGKRKKEAGSDSGSEDSKKRKRTSSDSDESSSNAGGDDDSTAAGNGASGKGAPGSESAQQRHQREPKVELFSYKLLDCPKRDCSKQYKADEGLKWHLSHSHPEFIGPNGEIREAADVEREEQERRRRRREEKEERRRKEQAAQNNADAKGTPSKQPRLDTDGHKTKSESERRGNSISNAAAQVASTGKDGRSNSQHTSDDLKQQRRMTGGADGTNSAGLAVTGDNQQTSNSRLPLPAISNSGVGRAPPANGAAEVGSPAAYSDISDDGDDSGSNSAASTPAQASSGRLGGMKFPTGISTTLGSPVGPPSHGSTLYPGGSISSATVSGSFPAPLQPGLAASSVHNSRPLQPGMHPATSSPSPRPPFASPLPPPPPPVGAGGGYLDSPRVSTPNRTTSAMAMLGSSTSTSASTASPLSLMSSPAVASVLGPPTDPQPGTPEYHKYLAANGFPPFPYPYPVGMDPNYHIQLLKQDPVYKAKWEKERAEKEKAFKEQLDRDQGRFSSLNLIKESSSSPASSRKPLHPASASEAKAEDLRKREPSGGSGNMPSPLTTDRRPSSRQSPGMISVKAEFREKEPSSSSSAGGSASQSADSALKRESVKDEGVKPTMETRGPPPGPQTFGYMHHSFMRPPYPLGGLPSPFDPMLVAAAASAASSISPYSLPPHLGGASPGTPNPYLSPSPHLGSPTGPPHPPGSRPPPSHVPFSFADPLLRGSFAPPGLASSAAAADELVRAAAAAGVAAAAGNPGNSLSGTKALDLLQQHASQYYANQKLAELQERALKSPNSSVRSSPGPSSLSSSLMSKPITTLAGKDSPTPIAAAMSAIAAAAAAEKQQQQSTERSSLPPSSISSSSGKSPPPLRHVHTHTHTHIGLGYPLLPPVPPVGGLPAPPGVGVPTVPFSAAAAPYKPA